MNNNNTYNRYFVLGALESPLDIDGWEAAERSFFKNKHGSVHAQRIHNHPARVIRIARQVECGRYVPQRSYRFPLTEPSPREIYAAFCEDRLVHHYVAPFISMIAEAAHNANGDVSHGNRIGHSAQTGAEQIRDAIRSAGDCIVLKVDFQSFFNSISRQKAYEVLAHYADIYYNKPDKEYMLSICRSLILHDPTTNCVKLCGNWDKIPPRKLMENAKEGCGLPIGNFYSQLIANLVLAIFDARLRKYGVCPRFVDDKCCIVKDMRQAKDCLKEAREVATELGLMLHPHKIYIQPAHRGVSFCGRTIKGNRIYLSNRTLKRAFKSIREADAVEGNALSVRNTANSYLGLMCHCTEYKNQRRLCALICERFGQWLYCVGKGGHYVCRIKDKYNHRKQIEQTINTIINETCKEYQRLSLLYRDRGRERGRRAA